jgi:N-acetylmuramoyl-L-alanine amidase
MEIVNHRLEDDNRIQTCEQTKCLSVPPEFSDKKYPDAIIIHYTAMYDAQAAVNALSRYTPGGRNASAHLVIGKKGEIFQLAPFNYKTWHAGTSFYNGRKSYNSFSIGIEIDNLGWLDSYEDGQYYSRPELLNLHNPIKVLPENVIKKKHSNALVKKEYWQKFTPEQIATVKEICDLISRNYTIKEILGHDEIAPERKQDPGPDFPIEWLRNQVLYSDREDKEELEPEVFQPFLAKVAATKLNIRSGPGVNEEKVAKPLLQGKSVTVVEKAGEWIKVKTEIEGWVNSKFVK